METASPSSSSARDSLLADLDAALGEIGELPHLDEARYQTTHQLFEGLSDQRARIIEELCRRVDPSAPADRPLRVLGIGCGAGEVDLALAGSLAASSGELVYVGVDPNRAQCEATEEMFADADLPRVRLDVAVETFDDFEAEQRFDVVHFVHSLYYMPDPAAALERARRLLGPGGELVIVQAPREELNELAVRFYDKSYARPTLFAGDVAELLTGWEWDFERDRIDARVDVTALDGDAEVGDALRDFIAQIDVRRLPGAVQELIERYLHLVAFESGDRSYIAHPVDAFFVSASAA